MNELIQNGDFVNIYMHEKTKKNIEKNVHMEKIKTTFHDFIEINQEQRMIVFLLIFKCGEND